MSQAQIQTVSHNFTLYTTDTNMSNLILANNISPFQLVILQSISHSIQYPYGISYRVRTLRRIFKAILHTVFTICLSVTQTINTKRIHLICIYEYYRKYLQLGKILKLQYLQDRKTIIERVRVASEVEHRYLRKQSFNFKSSKVFWILINTLKLLKFHKNFAIN